MPVSKRTVVALIALAYGVSTVAVANLFGSDRRIAFSSSASWLSSVGIVEQIDPQGKTLETCTGTLVGRRLVLTAAHCVARQNGELHPSIKTFFVSEQTRSSTLAPTFAVSLWSGDWKQEHDPRGGDWAILLLNRAPQRADALALEPIRVRDRPIDPGKKTALYGYSVDLLSGKQITADKNCEIRAVFSDGVFHHDCGAFAGASGGPIFAAEGLEPNETPELIGIHTAHKSDGTNGLKLAVYDSRHANLGTSASQFATTLSQLRDQYDPEPQTTHRVLLSRPAGQIF